MRNAISPHEMVNALRGIGFVDASRRSGHLVLRHQKTGLLVTLPTDRPYVPLVHIRAIMQQLVNYKIDLPEKLRELDGLFYNSMRQATR
jgi:predicted RNA binding protein YcfA (HicA-like mRNA interferase family)